MGSVGHVQSLLGRTTFQLSVVGAVMVVLLIIRVLRSRQRWEAARAVAAAALLVSVVGVLGLTLRPFHAPGTVEPMLWLDPVAGARGWNRIAWGPVIDNVALFVPVGAFAAATWWRRSALVPWLGCVALSVGIEATQYLVPTGRVANTADVIANATGALVGVLLALLLRARDVQRAQVRRHYVDHGAR